MSSDDTLWNPPEFSQLAVKRRQDAKFENLLKAGHRIAGLPSYPTWEEVRGTPAGNAAGQRKALDLIDHFFDEIFRKSVNR